MEHLVFDLPFQIRSTAKDTGDGRTLEGRIVPYDTEIEVGDGTESFARGVFADTDPSSVVLLWQHNTAEPLGRMTAIEDAEDGAYATFRLADTQRAKEAWGMANDGILKGLSVGFASLEARNNKGVRTHTKARLMETSLVTFPAYPTAGVLAVRQEDRMDEPIAEAEIVEEVTTETVDLAPLTTTLEDHTVQLREIRNEMSSYFAGASTGVQPPMSVFAAYGEMLQMLAKDPSKTFALTDIVGTSPGHASGLIHDQWVTELVGYINALRPLISAAGGAQFPSNGYGKEYPKVTQHTQVAKRTGEKTAVASREMVVATVRFGMEWFAGANDISLELIAQSDPDVVEVHAADLMDQYAVVTEAEFAVDVVAAATAAGAALPTGTWGAFVTALIGESAEIRAATGQPGNRLAVTTATWMALVGLLNPSQPSVSYGAGPDFTQESFPVGGISVFHAPALASDVLFNTKALRFAERPPEQVSATNVALMGRDFGIIGATIAIPLYPAGIHKFTV